MKKKVFFCSCFICQQSLLFQRSTFFYQFFFQVWKKRFCFSFNIKFLGKFHIFYSEYKINWNPFFYFFNFGVKKDLDVQLFWCKQWIWDKIWNKFLAELVGLVIGGTSFQIWTTNFLTKSLFFSKVSIWWWTEI